MLLRLFCLIALVIATVVCLAIGAFESYMWLLWLPLMALGIVLLQLVLAFLFLLVLASAVDLKKEQDHDSKLYRKTIELYLDAALPPLRWNIKTKGMDKVPADGRFLVVCNHVSLADPVVLLHVFAGRQLAFIAKQENQGLFIVGKVMHKMLCQPINRENDREALKTIVKCIQILRDDKASVAVFPEGYIHLDRKLHHFRSGVFKIAQKAEVPIVVCTLKNTLNAIPNLLHHRHSNIEASVLEVIYPEEFMELHTTDIAQRVYEIMAADLGPENVSQEENA